ncbi:MAG: hypothetical protein INR73_24760 [Williamsia sp.]|nr:hypothetical protein [Williamsia sp.]
MDLLLGFAVPFSFFALMLFTREFFTPSLFFFAPLAAFFAGAADFLEAAFLGAAAFLLAAFLGAAFLAAGLAAAFFAGLPTFFAGLPAFFAGAFLDAGAAFFAAAFLGLLETAMSVCFM